MKTPQRKPNKHLTGQELLAKAVKGTHIPKTNKQKLEEGFKRLLKG